jgi:uncharacterized OsmC-like protein/pimeloyl-ACP methyl ester carboxylesterase
MASRTFEFTAARGATITGVLETPVASPRGWAIFAHCFTCSQNDVAARCIARGLARAGIGVLRFDFAGFGREGLGHTEATFGSDIDDIIAAAHAMTAADMAPNLLVGHSLGGAAVLAAAKTIPSVRALATIAAPASPAHALKGLDAASLERIETQGEAEVQLGGRPFVIRRSFIHDLRKHDLLQVASQLHLPYLVLHAPGDDVVGIENATQLFLAAHHPKSFISLDGADHVLSERRHAEFAAAVIAAWAGGSLPETGDEILPLEPAPGALAEELGTGRFATRLTIGGTELIADEPAGAGGGGQGPTPFELVCAGLAACTTMTLRLYADRKGIPLHRAKARVVHTRRTDAVPVDLFARTLTLEGPLTEDQRARLIAISERCPVDLALARGSEVTVMLDDAGSQDG